LRNCMLDDIHLNFVIFHNFAFLCSVDGFFNKTVQEEASEMMVDGDMRSYMIHTTKNEKRKSLKKI